MGNVEAIEQEKYIGNRQLTQALGCGCMSEWIGADTGAFAINFIVNAPVFGSDLFWCAAGFRC